jgi:hypothetical protein
LKEEEEEEERKKGHGRTVTPSVLEGDCIVSLVDVLL